MAKILIVDDSAMSRRILRRMLEAAGHQVTEAEDGIVAIERYFLEKPDVLLLDLIMKGLSGMEVLQKIREMDKSACVANHDRGSRRGGVRDKALQRKRPHQRCSVRSGGAMKCC